jgi:hypothetical protein
MALMSVVQLHCRHLPIALQRIRACRRSWSGQEHAQDVERALVDIAASSGARSTDEAIAFVAELNTRGRYQRDVY